MIEISLIKDIIRKLLNEYHAEYAILFGSYARGDATSESDIDIIVCGGKMFKKTDIFAFAEDFRELSGKDADVFEISEVEVDTPFYINVMNEGVKIA